MEEISKTISMGRKTISMKTVLIFEYFLRGRWKAPKMRKSVGESSGLVGTGSPLTLVVVVIVDPRCINIGSN